MKLAVRAHSGQFGVKMCQLHACRSRMCCHTGQHVRLSTETISEETGKGQDRDGMEIEGVWVEAGSSIGSKYWRESHHVCTLLYYTCQALCRAEEEKKAILTQIGHVRVTNMHLVKDIITSLIIRLW